jgi:tetratricopeptide (TPR) repeat protein
MNHLALPIILVAALISGTATAQGRAAPFHECDRLAGNPIDPDHVGPGVPTFAINAVPAIEACLAALNQYPGEARFQFQLGRAYRQTRDYDNAVRWYSAAADQGYAGAQNSLGVMYSRGEGVVENCTTAAHLFELAAAQAYPAAIRNLGTLSCVRLV